MAGNTTIKITACQLSSSGITAFMHVAIYRVPMETMETDINNNDLFRIPTFSVGPEKIMYNTVTIQYKRIRYRYDTFLSIPFFTGF